MHSDDPSQTLPICRTTHCATVDKTVMDYIVEALQDAAHSEPNIMNLLQPNFVVRLHLQLKSSAQIATIVYLIGLIVLRSDVTLILVLPAISSDDLGRQACIELLEEPKMGTYVEQVSVDFVQGLTASLCGRTYAAALRNGVQLFSSVPLPLKQLNQGLNNAN